MLPIPKEFGDPTLFLEDTPDNIATVAELLRLSTAKRSELRPLWASAPTLVAAQLQLTNLAPLVLYGYDVNHMLRFQRIIQASLYSPRRLIILGPRSMVLRDGVERIQNTLKVEAVRELPLEAIGAYHLKEHMLRKS